MKTVKFFLIGLVITSFAFYSCSNENHSRVVNPPSVAAWNNLKASAFEKFVQRDTIGINYSSINFVSEKGVSLTISTYCLEFEDGTPIDQNGQIELEYVEIFDKGSMAITNKPTMGHNGDGNKRLLETGGEFYVNATQDGKKLVATCNYPFMHLVVPVALTTDAPDMSLWSGVIDSDGNLTWVEEDNNAGGTAGQGEGGVRGDGVNYYVNFGNFGWTNIDRFYSFDGEKTTILVTPPAGYNHKNSAVYVSVDGEGMNQLAQLDMFTEEGCFSEHYGYLPIGLDIHLIFVSENNGQWVYGIKGVKIEKDKIYKFTDGDLITGTEAQLIAAINAIQ